ncbi:MAG: hypothetical protein MK193_01920 [Lentisphaeria bacterium]|nr:hypothetical protein [Lentisphaeria bacterium]
MSDLNNSYLIPMLVSHDWPGVQQCVTSPLNPQDAERSPRIALAIESADRIDFLAADAPFMELLEEAQENLTARTESYGVLETMQFKGRKKQAKVAILQDDMFTAAQILQEAYHQKIQSLIKQEFYYVSLPSRSTILACEDLEVISKKTNNLYNEAVAEGEPVIGLDIYKFTNLGFQEVIQRDADLAQAITASRYTMMQWDSPEVQEVVEDNEIDIVISGLKLHDGASWEEAIEYEVRYVVEELKDEINFTGNIHFVIENDAASSIEVIAQSITKRLADEELETLNGYPIQIHTQTA